jgi:hypothetical protein
MINNIQGSGYNRAASKAAQKNTHLQRLKENDGLTR